MTHLALIRHGTTDWNAEQRVQGHTDIPLNDTGRSQARALAARLQAEKWDRIYASDLSRARETAEIVAAAVGLPVQIDPRLREMSCGQMEGTTEADRVARWGSDWRALDLGIESRQAITGRGLAFVRHVLAAHPDERVLVFSHGALLRLTVKELVPGEGSRERLRPASYTQLVNREGVWNCACYNCTLHLQ